MPTLFVLDEWPSRRVKTKPPATHSVDRTNSAKKRAGSKRNKSLKNVKRPFASDHGTPGYLDGISGKLGATVYKPAPRKADPMLQVLKHIVGRPFGGR